MRIYLLEVRILPTPNDQPGNGPIATKGSTAPQADEPAHAQSRKRYASSSSEEFLEESNSLGDLKKM